MADYFTNFSLLVPLPSAAAEKYALDIASKASRIQQGDEAPADFPTSLSHVVECWYFEAEPSDPSNGCGLWLHSSNGGIDAVCAFIQHLLQRFNPEGHIGFEWSCDCSKPRVDAYGGGAALITAAKVSHISTGAWLDRKIARLTAKKPPPEIPPAPSKKGETP